MKATAIAPSNIAFIKYWGKKDYLLNIPMNGSISMNLSNLLTTTTVEFDMKYAADEVILNGEKNSQRTYERVVKHLEKIRNMADVQIKAKVVSQNNFPESTGLSSSASGFAALTLAATKAVGLDLSEKELSILARQGSGSACRSVSSGFVEWLDGEMNDDSYAVTIFPADYWDIVDIVAIVSTEKKEVPSSEGQKCAVVSPFFQPRVVRMKNKIELCKKLIEKKDFTRFGELIEAEALEMHAVMITSVPSLLYWTPQTLMMMKQVQKWRKEGLETYFTINTGQDVHIIAQKKDETVLKKKLKELPYIKDIISNEPSKGVHISSTNLF